MALFVNNQEVQIASRVAGQNLIEIRTDAGTSVFLINNAGNIVTLAGLASMVITILQELSIPASSMRGTVTNPAGDANGFSERAQSAVQLVNYDYLAFDTTTEENAYFQWSPPKGWNEGTITFRVKWTNTAGLATETVVFGLKAIALSNDDAIDTAFGAEITVTDTFLAQNDVHTSPESAAVTIGGTPAEGDIVFFNIARKTGLDNLTGDARLKEVIITFTRNILSDA